MTVDISYVDVVWKKILFSYFLLIYIYYFYYKSSVKKNKNNKLKIKIMKKIIVSLVVVLSSMFGVVRAQVEHEVKLSGNVTLLSMTNSTLSGGYFSQNPALRGIVSASYKDFSLMIMRNSDLADSESGANLFALSPSWSHSFGKYDVMVATEFDLFDYETSMNMVAPYVTVERNGLINFEVMVAYATMFKGGDLNIQMLAVSKNYAGYMFKFYVWNVNWGSNKQNTALEISRNVSDHVKMSVYGHLNDIFERNGDMSYFGAIRVGYSF